MNKSKQYLIAGNAKRAAKTDFNIGEVFTSGEEKMRVVKVRGAYIIALDERDVPTVFIATIEKETNGLLVHQPVMTIAGT